MKVSAARRVSPAVRTSRYGRRASLVEYGCGFKQAYFFIVEARSHGWEFYLFLQRLDYVRRYCTVTAVFAAAALTLLLSLEGCGSGGNSPPVTEGGGTTAPIGESIVRPGWRSVSALAPQPRRQSFLVYMNAANNLEEFSGLNINQMETVGSTEGVNLLVQVKKFANRYDPGFTDWNDTATRRFLIRKDSDQSRIGSPVLLQKEGVDAGNAQTLQEFVQWGIRSFPAERYCLVVWNHGAGWRSVKDAGKATRGVSYDDQTGNNINTIDLPAALDMGGRAQVGPSRVGFFPDANGRGRLRGTEQGDAHRRLRRKPPGRRLSL